MKFKGKIVQIIREEDRKSETPRMENTDWLNIRPIPELKRKAHLWFLGLFVGGFVLGLIIDSYINKWISLAVTLVMWGVGLYLLRLESKANEKILPYGWYFGAPIPIKKPHNFKVNDEVEISLEVNNPVDIKKIQDIMMNTLNDTVKNITKMVEDNYNDNSPR